MTDDSPKRDESAEPDAEPGEEANVHPDPEADTEPDAQRGAQPDSDPLRLVLHTMEEQLDRRVGAVSSARPSHEESTSGLIQLEETLSSAQDKAKQLVTLRLKLDEEASLDQGRTDSSANAPESSRRPSSPPTTAAGRLDEPDPPPPR